MTQWAGVSLGPPMTRGCALTQQEMFTFTPSLSSPDTPRQSAITNAGSATPPPPPRVPTLICHCEERPLIPSLSRDVAISMNLSTRRRTAVAMTTGLPRCARNDTVGRRESVRPFGGLGMVLRRAQDERGNGLVWTWAGSGCAGLAAVATATAPGVAGVGRRDYAKLASRPILALCQQST